MSSASPAESPVRLRTGALTAVVADGALREVRVAGHLALDAVYAAVRDPDWGTVPGEFEQYDISVSPDAFTVAFTSRHRAAGLDFRWHGRIEGHDGAVRLDFDGVALERFAANRIGFCLLHPIGLAGQPVLARTPDGERSGHFPEHIAPHQPFTELRGLRYRVAAGTWLDLTLDGELFEMEDHRNWTDAGWKTYGTPLRLPHPRTYRAGDTVRQTVRITADAEGTPVAVPDQAADLWCEVTGEVTGRLPAIGLGVSGPGVSGPSELGPSASGADVSGLARPVPAGLRPDHLHLDLAAGQDWTMLLRRAAAEVAALGARLDVAFTAPADTDWPDTAAMLSTYGGRVGRVSVFDPATQVTEPGTASTLRAALRRAGLAIPVGGGSRNAFAELNRARLPAAELDFVTYRIHPQAHHFDDKSIMDTLLAQPHTVRDARRLAAGLPLVVGPITLGRPAETTAALPAGHPDQPSPDPRQGTDFLAAWTLGSIAALADADALTYFRTTGLHGLRTGPDDVFPVWRVFAAIDGTGRNSAIPGRHPAPRARRARGRPGAHARQPTRAGAGGTAAGRRAGTRAGASAVRRAGGVPMTVLGCVADDYTGGTDVAVALRRAGLGTVLFFGEPRASWSLDGCATAVVALKTRGMSPEDATRASLAAYRWLRAQAVPRVYIKYCSTFDSTDDGQHRPGRGRRARRRRWPA